MKAQNKTYINIFLIVLLMTIGTNFINALPAGKAGSEEVRKKEDIKIPTCSDITPGLMKNKDYDLLNLEDAPTFKTAFKINGTGASQIGGTGTDQLGNIYVTGGYTGTLEFNTQPVQTTITSTSGFDFFLAKYDASGNCIWVRRAAGSSDIADSISVDGAISIVVDKAGNVYTGGTFVRSLTFLDGADNNLEVLTCANPLYTNLELFVAKYNTDGDLLWAIGGNSGSHGDASLPKTAVNGVTSIVLDVEDNPYIGGRFSGDTFLGHEVGLEEDGDFFLAALNPDNGEVDWGVILGTYGEDGVVALALDTYGYINALGFMGQGTIVFPTEDEAELTNENEYEDTFIAKFDVNGNCLWADIIGGDEDIFGESIATDTLGNIFITGTFKGTVSFTGSDLTLTSTSADGDGYLAKYDFDGYALWARKFGDEFFAAGNRITVDEIGNSFVLGTFDSTVVFGSESQGNEIKLLTDSYIDMFIAGYDSAGKFLWTKKLEDCGYGGIGQISTSALRVRNNPLQLSYSNNNGGEILMAGDFNNRIILDNIALDAPDGARNTFIAKLNVSNNPTAVKEINSLPMNYSLSQNYPNPFNPSTFINYQLPVQSNVSLKIYDMLGKEVNTLVNETKPAGNYNVNFNATNLSSGIYFYTLKTAQFNQSKKMILLK